MYESFYNLSEKPFTLLPDPGFLYMSDKHRMALTLLEYGLMNHAGFTVISGDIGTGKTTLIRHVLNNMDREHTVGLISNTHRDFGELLQWILLAFNLEHSGMNKVEMYQCLVDFIIDEYAHNRRTVLIVDEAQNMAPETLEELRMLSNINADKDQALQVILVGQRELRETLQRPDLAQFAQRISVDYHLQPLSENETAGYIRHRLEVAGGDPDIFTGAACEAVHRYSGGVPRLINLLCDTALVYGYAEQKHRIDARLVTDVAREKQAGGIFPTFDLAGFEEVVGSVTAPAESAPVQQAGTADGLREDPPGPEPDPAENDPVEIEQPAGTADRLREDPSGPEPDPAENDPVEMEQPAAHDSQETIDVDIQTEEPAVDFQPTQPTPPVESSPEPKETRSTQGKTEYRWEHGHAKKKARLALCSAHEELRNYLSRLLEGYGIDVVISVPLDMEHVTALDPEQFDVLLIDRDEGMRIQSPGLLDILAPWRGPLIYNDTQAIKTALQRGNYEFGNSLANRIAALADSSRTKTGT